MRLYFTSSQIPEMANLSIAQRRFVRERCLLCLCRRLSYQVGHYAVLAIALISVVLFTWKRSAWATAALAAAAALIVNSVYHMIAFARWRADVSRFIEVHAEEIKARA